MSNKNIKLIKIEKSDKKNKKWDAIFEITNKKGNDKLKITSFGYDDPDDKDNDFTKHNDLERRNRYIIRHEKDLRTGDPTRAGYLSLFILWNLPTLKSSIEDYKDRLNIYNNTGKFPTDDLIDEAKTDIKNDD
tara:strand:+ start:587 stop:985 length:399 start_codon:yes stop_codon:yes gene_type:complete